MAPPSRPRPGAAIMRLLAAAALLLLGGCASGATVQGMTAIPVDAPRQAFSAEFRGAIGIGIVTGGEDTNPLWTSEVGNAEFDQALRRSLQIQDLYAGTDDSRYLLDAHLLDLNQPLMGFATTVTSSVKYRITERATKQTVLEELVVSSYTAQMSDSWYGVERLRLANEGSLRDNIAEFIKRLSERLPQESAPES
jgi:hypothetical protein